VLDIEKVTIDLLSSLREELGHDTVELSVRSDIPDLAGCLVEFHPTNPQSAPIGIMATSGAEVASAEVMVGTGWQESWELEDEHRLQRYRAELEAIVRAAANGQYEEVLWLRSGHAVAADGELIVAGQKRRSSMTVWLGLRKLLAERRSIKYQPYSIRPGAG
jgi:hypothetical protein